MHREVQRILMELLNQMDGFDQNVNVKVPHAAPYAIHAIQSRLQKKCTISQDVAPAPEQRLGRLQAAAS